MNNSVPNVRFSFLKARLAMILALEPKKLIFGSDIFMVESQARQYCPVLWLGPSLKMVSGFIFNPHKSCRQNLYP